MSGGKKTSQLPSPHACSTALSRRVMTTRPCSRASVSSASSTAWVPPKSGIASYSRGRCCSAYGRTNPTAPRGIWTCCAGGRVRSRPSAGISRRFALPPLSRMRLSSPQMRFGSKLSAQTTSTVGRGRYCPQPATTCSIERSSPKRSVGPSRVERRRFLRIRRSVSRRRIGRIRRAPLRSGHSPAGQAFPFRTIRERDSSVFSVISCCRSWTMPVVGSLVWERGPRVDRGAGLLGPRNEL